MKKYLIEIEWKITDTREDNGSFRLGVSSLVVSAKSKEMAINNAIDFCNEIPSWEFERNQIDLNDYREGNICRYFYRTQITRIIRCKVIKDRECR